MQPATEYFILQANDAEALAEIASQAFRDDHKQPLGHPFSIIRPDGSVFCVQVSALFELPLVFDRSSTSRPNTKVS